MLSMKTAERSHVPAATSIQIYSISPICPRSFSHGQIGIDSVLCVEIKKIILFRQLNHCLSRSIEIEISQNREKK